MSSAIFSFLGWSFLPDFCTGKLQEFWYNFTYRAGSPKPQPGTPLWVKHRRRIYFGVIVVYLLYTLYEADWNIRRAGDFYSDLGVLQDVGEKELNSRFRRITLQFHPDKLPPNLSPPQRQAAEARYIQLQLAKDTLLDPAKRFAYDRLGADITEWKHAKTIRDFVIIGGRRMIPFYIGSIIGMVGAQWFGVFDTSGSYWRYLTLLALFLFELRTITSPSSLPITSLATLLNPLHNLLQTFHLTPLTTILHNIFATPRPPYLPFQSVQLAHRATITLFIALSRLAPLFTPPVPRGASSAEEAEIVGAVQKLEGLVGAYTGDAARLLALEAVAFGEQPGAGTDSDEGRGYAQLLPHIRNFLVTNTVRQDPQIRAAVTAVLARKRGHAGDNVLGDVGLQQQDLSTENEAVRQEEKTMEELGWIASATSPGTSFFVDGDDKNHGNFAREGEEAEEEESKEESTNNSAQAPISTSTQQPTQKSKHTTPPSPQIPHPTTTTTSHPRRNSKSPLNTSPSTGTDPAPAALPLLDPGELADTEGETPAPTPAPTPHHKHNHSHSHKTNLGASVEMLGESEIREAKKEMEKVEGYEGDVDV